MSVELHAATDSTPLPSNRPPGAGRATAGVGPAWFGHFGPIRSAAYGILLLWLLLVLVAVLIPELFTRTDMLAADPSSPLIAPNAEHWFGTDQLGRDEFARVVHGLRLSLGIGVGAMLISAIVGTLFGLLAGLGSTAADEVVSRGMDVLSAFPAILLAMLIIAFTQPGALNLTIAIGIASIPKFARVVRAETLVVRRADYVTHSIMFGASRAAGVVRHVLPNVLSLIPVLAMIDVGTSVIAGSGLSFLQLGVQPPTPELGVMLAESRNFFGVAWWLAIFPGAVLSLTVIALTTLGTLTQKALARR